MPAFWDTSAIVHLCVPSPSSSTARHLLRDHAPVIWWCTPVEARSAIERLYAERALSLPAYRAATQRAAAMLGAWREIQPTDGLRELAFEALAKFQLRAADSLQLAAAQVWCRRKPHSRVFVSNDIKLLAAAADLGFVTRSV